MTSTRCPKCGVPCSVPDTLTRFYCPECNVPLVILGNFSKNDRLFMEAVRLGCTPVWMASLSQWECRCPRSEHGESLSRPTITERSLERALVTL